MEEEELEVVEESEEENNQPERDSGTTRDGEGRGYATTNQLERGTGKENDGATRDGWRNRVAEDAVTREEVAIQPPQTWFGRYILCNSGLP